VTDASIVLQEPRVQGQKKERKKEEGSMCMLDSDPRRLKELILATAAPGESISDHDMLVTGHSLLEQLI
jgi:hypothetical protein